MKLRSRSLDTERDKIPVALTPNVQATWLDVVRLSRACVMEQGFYHLEVEHARER
jgi:hypothetical protein